MDYNLEVLSGIVKSVVKSQSIVRLIGCGRPHDRRPGMPILDTTQASFRDDVATDSDFGLVDLEPVSQAARPAVPHAKMLGTDIDPAAAVTGAVVAAIEPLDAKPRTLASIVGMPGRKTP